MKLIKNARMLMENGSFAQSMDILFDKKIIRTGSKLAEEYQSADCEIMDAQDRYVTPGLIDAHCHIGICENGMGFEGEDVNEITNPITPALRGLDGINPRDESFAEAREAGVTAVLTGPGSANVIGGSFCALKTFGSTIEDMLIKEPAALKAALGENPKRCYNERKASPMTRMATAALLREAFYKAGAYGEKKRRAAQSQEEFELDMSKERLLDVLEGRLRLKIHCHRADDIQTAIRIAEEFNISYTLDHCTEGYMMLDIIKRHNAQCILGPILIGRPKIEMKNLNYGGAAVFEREGVEFALSTDHPETPVQLLSASAAFLVRNGLSEEAAMRAMTVNAARITGLADRIGSLKPGLDADIVVFDGHPLDVRTKVSMTIIDGNIVYGGL
ncbi:MAG TPA: amidohydrolase [Firmicutes bacterium]|nr:amidohydrolase [Bacillota bacterium]